MADCRADNSTGRRAAKGADAGAFLTRRQCAA
jgi:hypothetical protein